MIKPTPSLDFFREKADEQWAETLERFWGKVKILAPDECWDWQAFKDKPPNHYGRLSFQGKLYTAHRFAYMITHGEIPEGLVVMHSCDNPPCVNPEHLSLGTRQDNIDDCVNKERRANLKGSAHPRALLDEETVNAIRECNSTGDFTFVQIGKAFKVRPGLVADICWRRIWRHV